MRRQVGADDDVLLGLDGGDDVAHRARRAAARSRPRGSRECSSGLAAPARSLVLVRRQPAVLEAVPPAQPDAHRLGAAGPVERQADRGPPVDHHRLAGLVGDVPAADVEAPRRSLRSRAGRRTAGPSGRRRAASSAARTWTRGTPGSPSRRRPTSPSTRCARASAPAARASSARCACSAASSVSWLVGHDGASAVAGEGWGSVTLPARDRAVIGISAGRTLGVRRGRAPSPSGWCGSRCGRARGRPSRR